MLEFVKNVFRGLFVVFLWLNLIGSVIAGLVLGITGGGGWIIVGLIGGLIVGLLTNILWGGFVATILCIEDKIDAFDYKYTKSLKLLETNSGILENIKRDRLSSPVKDVSSGHSNTDQGAELNAVYDAVITRVVDLGAFAEYLPGQKGMIAITEIAQERVAKVDDVLRVGDKVRVKVIGFERSGSAKLSIKALL